MHRLGSRVSVFLARCEGDIGAHRGPSEKRLETGGGDEGLFVVRDNRINLDL